MADFLWGTAYGMPGTLSFWVRSNVSTIPVIFKTWTNGAATIHAYFTNVTITASATWQYVTISIAAPPTGSGWTATNTDQYQVLIGSYNSGNQISTTNAWTVGNNYPNYNIYSTLGNYVEFTGVQFEKGTIATPFEFRPYAVELALCQRYYYSIKPLGIVGNNNNIPAGVAYTFSTTGSRSMIALPVPMRTNGITLVTSTGSAGVNTNVSQPGNSSCDITIWYNSVTYNPTSVQIDDIYVSNTNYVSVQLNFGTNVFPGGGYAGGHFILNQAGTLFAFNAEL